MRVWPARAWSQEASGQGAGEACWRLSAPHLPCAAISHAVSVGRAGEQGREAPSSDLPCSAPPVPVLTKPKMTPTD